MDKAYRSFARKLAQRVYFTQQDVRNVVSEYCDRYKYHQNMRRFLMYSFMNSAYICRRGTHWEIATPVPSKKAYKRLQKA